MTVASETKRAQARGAALLALLAVGILILRTMSAQTDPLAALASSGNDDIMRFLSVRDWLAGQSWFDMRQTGVVAEGGLTLHWSRLVDAGISAIIYPASWFMPMEQAEALGLLTWPLVLYAVLICCVARAATEVFGLRAAVGAVLCLLLWQPFTVHFAPGRVDHHNVQILLLTLAILALLRARAGWWAGVTAGVATGLSLAVGLETLLALGLVGVILSFYAVWNPRAFCKALLGYGLSLGIAAAVFFAAQTHPSHWVAAYCDQLSAPLLVPVLAASVAAVVLAKTMPQQSIMRNRLAAFAVCYGAAGLIGAPMLAGCLEGPYGALPQAVEQAIYTDINEAKPVLVLIAEMPGILHVAVLPMIFVLGTASVMYMFDRDTARREAAGVLLIFAWVSVLAMLYQFRSIVICAAVLPMLTGYVLGWSLPTRYHPGTRARARLAAAAVALASIFYPVVWDKADARQGVAAEIDIAVQQRQTALRQCRTEETLSRLRDLPRGVVFSTLNLSPPILLTTGHPIVVAPYHRSASALSNSFIPFEQDESGFRASLHSMNADYIILCREERQRGFVGELSRGVDVTGFKLLPQTDDILVVYEVIR